MTVRPTGGYGRPARSWAVHGRRERRLGGANERGKRRGFWERWWWVWEWWGRGPSDPWVGERVGYCVCADVAAAGQEREGALVSRGGRGRTEGRGSCGVLHVLSSRLTWCVELQAGAASWIVAWEGKKRTDYCGE